VWSDCWRSEGQWKTECPRQEELWSQNVLLEEGRLVKMPKDGVSDTRHGSQAKKAREIKIALSAASHFVKALILGLISLTLLPVYPLSLYLRCAAFTCQESINSSPKNENPVIIYSPLCHPRCLYYTSCTSWILIHDRGKEL